MITHRLLFILMFSLSINVIGQSLQSVTNIFHHFESDFSKHSYKEDFCIFQSDRFEINSVGIMKDHSLIADSDIRKELKAPIFLPLISITERSGNKDSIKKTSTERIFAKQYLANFILIPYHAGLELARIDRQGLQRNVFFMGILAGTLIIDQPVRNFVQNNIYSGDYYTTRFLYNIGLKEYFIPIYVSTYGVSLLLKDKYLQNTMFLGIQSLIINQGVTELAKASVMRVRPRHSPDDPFVREKGNQSFISGHSSAMWAAMTVFAGRYPEIKYFAYGLAAAVALARVYEDAHWASDIFMGSLVGYGIGRMTLRLNQNPVNSNLTVVPFINYHVQGASVRYNF